MLSGSGSARIAAEARRRRGLIVVGVSAVVRLVQSLKGSPTGTGDKVVNSSNETVQVWRRCTHCLGRVSSTRTRIGEEVTKDVEDERDAE